jgi:hypothetical protein
MSTLSYLFPVTASTPPSQAVMANHSLFVADVFLDDGDTTVLVTHNMQISSADIARGFPLLRTAVSTAASALVPLILSPVPISGFGNITPLTAAVATNSVTLVKDAGGGTGGTIRLVMERPYSQIR